MFFSEIIYWFCFTKILNKVSTNVQQYSVFYTATLQNHLNCSLHQNCDILNFLKCANNDDSNRGRNFFSLQLKVSFHSQGSRTIFLTRKGVEAVEDLTFPYFVSESQRSEFAKKNPIMAHFGVEKYVLKLRFKSRLDVAF